MVLKKSTVISIGLFAALFLAAPLDTSAEEQSTVFFYSDSNSAVVMGKSFAKAASESMEKDTSKLISSTQNGNSISVNLEIEGNSVQVSGDLVKGAMKIFQNNGNWIGTNLSSSDSRFTVKSLYLMEQANNTILMPQNLEITGKPIIGIAVEDSDGKIHYWQEEAKSLSFSKLSTQSSMKKDDVLRKEQDSYSFTANKNSAIESAESTETINEGDIIKQHKDYRGSIYPAVPDFFFKIPADSKWHTVDEDTYTYGAYKINFAGTDNIQNFFQFIDLPIFAGWENQIFSTTASMLYRDNIIYNVYDGKFYIDTNSRTVAKDFVLQSYSRTDGSCFINRLNSAVSSGNVLDKILSSLWGMAPYGISAVQDWVSPLQPDDVVTGGYRDYQSTPAKQIEVYGKLIKGLQSNLSGLNQKNDMLTLNGNAVGIKSHMRHAEWMNVYK